MAAISNQQKFQAYVQLVRSDNNIDNNFTRDDHLKADFNAALPLIASAQDSLDLSDAFDKPWQGSTYTHDVMMRKAYERGLALATTPQEVGAIMADAHKRMDNAGSVQQECQAKLRQLAGLPPEAPAPKHSFWKQPLVLAGCIATAAAAVLGGAYLGILEAL